MWTKLVLPSNFNGAYVARSRKQPPGVVYLAGRAPLSEYGELLGDVRFTRNTVLRSASGFRAFGSTTTLCTTALHRPRRSLLPEAETAAA